MKKIIIRFKDYPRECELLESVAGVTRLYENGAKIFGREIRKEDLGKLFVRTYDGECFFVSPSDVVTIKFLYKEDKTVRIEQK